jgi:hypothetical protein
MVYLGEKLEKVKLSLLCCIWILRLYAQIYILHWLPSANKLLSSSVFQKIHYFFSLISILKGKIGLWGHCALSMCVYNLWSKLVNSVPIFIPFGLETT